jgi:hypothetical protein
MKKTRPKASRKDPLQAALDVFRAWGREGGKLRWKGLTAEQRREIARGAARARWSKAKKKG